MKHKIGVAKLCLHKALINKTKHSFGMFYLYEMLFQQKKKG